MHGRHRLGTSVSGLSFPNHNLVPRTDSGSTLSSTTIIIIAVCCSVGGFVFGLLLWRIVRSCRSKSAPLPPVQPLVHHRELLHQEADKLHKAPIWNFDPASGTPLVTQGGSHLRVFGFAEGGDSTLFPPHHRIFQEDETSDTTSSSLVDPSLLLPNPAFRNSSSSSVGRDSSTSGNNPVIASADTFSITPVTPPSATSISTFSHSQSNQSHLSSVTMNSSQPLTTPQATTISRSRSSRSRPVSMVSIASTSYTSTSLRTNRNVIHGAPHGPHSSIQIVLPTPLAPQLYPHLDDERKFANRESFSARSSYVDRWTIVPSRSTSQRTYNTNSASLPPSLRNPMTRSHTGHSPSHMQSYSRASHSRSSSPSRHYSPHISAAYPWQSTETPSPVPPLPPFPPEISVTSELSSAQSQVSPPQQQLYILQESLDSPTTSHASTVSTLPPTFESPTMPPRKPRKLSKQRT